MALNKQITLLSAYKMNCDYTVQRADSLIADYKKSQSTLREIVANKDMELSNNQTEISNLNLMLKKQRKKGIKKMLYYSGGALGVGLIMGVLIAK